MDKLRYGKYFDNLRPTSTKKVHVNWHRVKQSVQEMYQREMEEQGAILKELFIAREATEDSKAVDYLLWINYQWDLYVKNLQRGEFKFDNFIDFVQSDLSKDEELKEPDCYGSRKDSASDTV